MGSRRKLPIGIQTFRTIREEGCYYVDKTAYQPVAKVADSAWPRRGRTP